MKKYTQMVHNHGLLAAAVLALFLLQLTFLGGLSDNLHNLRTPDTGDHGRQYLVAESMTSATWEKITFYMTDSEKASWTQSYEKDAEGDYILLKSVQFEDTLEELENRFLMPQAVVWQIGRTDSQEAFERMTARGYDPNDYMSVRDYYEEVLEAKGDEAVRQAAASLISQEGTLTETSGSAGGFYVRKILWILTFLVLTALSAAGFYTIYRWFISESRQLRRQQAGAEESGSGDSLQEEIYTFLKGSGFLYAVLLLIYTIYQMIDDQAAIGFIVAGLIIALLLIAAALILPRTPAYARLQKIADLTLDKNLAKKSLLMGLSGIIPGILVLFTLSSLGARGLTYFLYLLAAGLCIAAILSFRHIVVEEDE